MRSQIVSGSSANIYNLYFIKLIQISHIYSHFLIFLAFIRTSSFAIDIMYL
jgi:hypothetical protein